MTHVRELLIQLLDEVRGLREDLRANAAASASPLLEPDEVANLLKVSSRTLRRLELLGEIPAPIVFGGSRRWRRADLERVINERGAA